MRKLPIFRNNQTPNTNLQLKRGFTLIELTVVMAVMGILATMALFGLNTSQAAARDASRVQIMTAVQSALERYYGEYQYYPICVTFGGLFNSGSSCAGPLANFMNAPVDPDKSCTTLLSSVGGTNWSPCPSDTTKPRYVYTALPTGCSSTPSSCQQYKLSLVKQSGGTIDFYNPN